MAPADTPRALPRNLITALVHPWTWRMAWRDSRAQRQRLVIFSLAIVAGIAALVAIHSLKASVEKAVGAQAKALLGSDLQISSRQPFSDADFTKLAPRALRISRETGFASMLFFSRRKLGATRPGAWAGGRLSLLRESRDDTTRRVAAISHGARRPAGAGNARSVRREGWRQS